MKNFLCLFLLVWVLAALAPAAQATATDDYKISTGDLLEFDFLDDEQAPKETAVSGAGFIQIPMLGSVSVGGLTVEEANAIIRKSLIDRKLYVEPVFSLVIKSFRPIFVLGDVNRPGSYPFQPYLSVEQAVGLAGGMTSSSSSTDDRVVTRIRLESELESVVASIGRESAWLARLQAELAGRKTILDEDLPKVSAPIVRKDQLAPFLEIEAKILATSRTSFESQTAILSGGIQSTKSQIETLKKLMAAQEKSIQFSRDALARVAKLSKNGLTTASDVSDAQRQLILDESRQLQILSDISRADQQLANISQQTVALNENQTKSTLIELRERQAELSKLMTQFKSTSELFYLATNWASIEAESQKLISVVYSIRRSGDAIQVQAGDISRTILQPGDTLLVAIARPNLDPSPTTSSTR
jgi:exopolysaccharide production protein ExoF